MATVLDVSLIQSFDIVFPVLLVFALVFSLLQKTKAISDSVWINSLIAVKIAFMVLLSDTLIGMINFMTPWFVVMIIFLILMILMFQVFGASESDVKSVLGDKAIQWTLVGVGLIILVASFGHVLGQSMIEQSAGGESVDALVSADGTATGSFDQNITAIMFHPKVLGMLIMFAIAIFAVSLLSS